MRRPVLVAVALVAIPGIASAQSLFNQGGSNSRGGSSSQLGQPSTVQSLQSLSSNSSSSNSSTSGTSGTQTGASFGSTANSMFNGSSRQLGGTGMGNRGTTGLQGQAAQPFQFGQFGQAVGNAGFIGANQSGFVGNRLAGQQSGQGLNQMMQAFQGLSRGGSGFNSQFGGSERPKLGIRPTQRIAFNHRTSTPAATTTRVTAQLSRVVDRRPELAGVTPVADDAGRIVLRGTVENEEAAALAVALVRLEPGVGEVVNELAVAPGTAP